jgi:cyanate permease
MVLSAIHVNIKVSAGVCINMSEMVADQTVSASKQQRYLPLLVLLFIGSGCAALIYEIVWFQILELVIGASSISLGILLGTFMGGMCVGSLFAPRLISRMNHPLRVYAYLEIGIGVLGLDYPGRRSSGWEYLYLLRRLAVWRACFSEEYWREYACSLPRF